MITNCAVMGCDWRDLTWWEYQARLSGWNTAHATDKPKPPPDVDRLKGLMAARG